MWKLLPASLFFSRFPNFLHKMTILQAYVNIQRKTTQSTQYTQSAMCDIT